ncbi:MAG: OmpA family protein [Myxococcales bacterium]|nr:OmpA family protein [Myxococcales bacterium]
MRGFLLCCVMLIASVGQAAPPMWDYTVKNVLSPGQPAELTLTPKMDVVRAALTLRTEGGESKTFHFKKLRANKPTTVKWPVPAGATNWTGDLIGTAGGSTVNMSVTLKIISAPKLDVRVHKSEIDVDAGKLSLTSNVPLDRVEVQGFDEKGAQVVDTSVPMPDQAGKQAVQFEVPPETNLRRLELKVYDRVGYWMAVRLVDWYTEVPHEDVEFATASAEIPLEQAAKLDQVVLLIQDEVNRFRAELGDPSARVDVKLYVAGFTDTVGTPADNLVLSRSRAHAIAKYFWTNGLGIPIYFEGFGESGLAVPTADEVDEQKNRRAMYILTNNEPRGLPNAHWRPLGK